MRLITTKLLGNRTNNRGASPATWRAKPRFTALSLVAVLLASCVRVVESSPLRSITVEREVLVQGVHGKSNAIAVTAGGSVTVAGEGQFAWAIGVDGDGRVLWKYKDPASKSIFLGVVPLLSGSWLLCGQANGPHGTVGLVAIVDAHGNIVERDEWTPYGDPKLTISRFAQCVPWGAGIALLGGTVMNPGAPRSPGGPSPGRSWFVQLDGNGKKVWETLSEEDLGVLAADSPRANRRIMVRADEHAGKEAATILRVSEKVEILKRRTIDDASGFAWIRRTAPNQDDQIVIYEHQKSPKIHSLDNKLDDIKPARSIEQIYIDQGCGYVLQNNYLALFGYVQKGGGGLSLTSPYTAAIALVDQSGRTVAINTFGLNYASFTVRDAAFIGENSFVAVRDVNGPDLEKNGIGISWIRFQ